MNTRLNDPSADFCWCDDAELDRVRALMAAGMGQVAASLVVWGSPMADLHAWTEERTRARFPWWRSEVGAADWSGVVMVACAVAFVALAVCWGRFA